MAMPIRQAVFSRGTMNRESYFVELTRGTHSAASSGALRSVGTQAVAIEIGQQWPASAMADSMKSAERATQAPGPGLVHGRECTSFSIDQLMSECHAG